MTKKGKTILFYTKIKLPGVRICAGKGVRLKAKPNRKNKERGQKEKKGKLFKENKGKGPCLKPVVSFRRGAEGEKEGPPFRKKRKPPQPGSNAKRKEALLSTGARGEGGTASEHSDSRS